MIDLDYGKVYKTRWLTTKTVSITTVKIGLRSVSSYGCDVFLNNIYNDTGFIDERGRLFVNGFDTLLEVFLEDQLELPVGYRRGCDCGGYMVYNNWGKEFHSNWCKVNR